MENEKQYRYPGPSPFTTAFASVFHGRSEDVAGLYDAILLNKCTVIVGRSGVGKTSLINAGILPKIEREMARADFRGTKMKVVRIRAFGYNASDKRSLLQQVKNCFIRDLGTLSADAENMLPNAPEALRASIGFLLKQYQWDHFKRDPSGKEIILIIFDQLEELFTYPAADIQQLERELWEMAGSNMPDALRFFIEEQLASNPDYISDALHALLEEPALVKFLLAIRSDKLSLLIRLSKAIPGIFQNPYELKPFSIQQAMKAITAPAEDKGSDYASPSFTYAPQALQKICNALEALPNFDPEYHFEANKIEPLTLQLICRHIERKIVPTDDDKVISPHEFDVTAIFANYYEDALAELKLEQSQLEQTMKFIEEKLIYESDRRRLIQYQESITGEFGIPIDQINTLVDAGLLRKIFSTGAKPSYELSHDWLVDAIIFAKQKRLQLAQAPLADMQDHKAIADISEKIQHSSRDYTLYQQRANMYLGLGRYEEAANDFTTAMQLKGSADIDIDLLLQRGSAYLQNQRFEEAECDYLKILEADPQHYLALYNTGVVYYEWNKMEQAKQAFQKCLAIDNSYVDAMNYLGVIAMNTDDDAPLAEKYFLQIMALNNAYKYPYYNLGLLRYKQEQFKEAEKYFEKAIELDEGYDSAWNYLGVVADRLNNKTKALEYFQKATALRPEDFQYQYNLAKMYFDGGRFQESMAVAETCVKLNNAYQAGYYLLSLAAFNMGDYKAAADWALQHGKWGATTDGLFQLGLSYYHLRQYDSAIEAFQQLSLLNTEHAEGLYYQIWSKELKGDIDGALADGQLGAKRFPADARFSYMAGRLLFNKGKLEAAKENYATCISIDPVFLNALIDMGSICRQLGSPKEAIDWLKKALAVKGDSGPALFELGIVNYDQQDNEAATDCFQQTVALGYHVADSNNYLGLLAERSEQFENAIQYYDAAIALDPGFHLAVFNKAIAAYLSNQFELSIPLFEQLIHAKMYLADCYNYLGAIENKQGNIAASLQHFEASLAANDQHEYALFNLAEANYLLGQFDKAAELFTNYLHRFPGDEEAKSFLQKMDEARQSNA